MEETSREETEKSSGRRRRLGSVCPPFEGVSSNQTEQMRNQQGRCVIHTKGETVKGISEQKHVAWSQDSDAI